MCLYLYNMKSKLFYSIALVVIIIIVCFFFFSGQTVINPWKQCPWMRPHMYDWIHHAPAIAVLLINLIFLFVIMWVSTRTLQLLIRTRQCIIFYRLLFQHAMFSFH